MEEKTILMIKCKKISEDKEEFSMVLADLEKGTKDRLQFFIFDSFLRDKIRYMTPQDIEHFESKKPKGDLLENE
jgi:hypothetical protein